MKAPEIKRNHLILLAGVAWTTVGAALIMIALGWLVSIHRHVAILIVGGLAAGAIIYYFGFSKIATINLARIRTLAPEKDKICLFAFQNKRSYFIVAAMMSMGYGLRHSALPRIYLVPIYGAIGLALLFSSFHYYQNLR